jgi:hypothetical protein
VLSGELALSGGVEDRLDQQGNVAVVNAGDGVAEGDGCLAREAGGQAEHSALPARALRRITDRVDDGDASHLQLVVKLVLHEDEANGIAEAARQAGVNPTITPLD